MKVYHVYAINPMGEKSINRTYTNIDDAESFLAKLDETIDPSFDAGIDEESIEEVLKRYEAYNDNEIMKLHLALEASIDASVEEREELALVARLRNVLPF